MQFIKEFSEEFLADHTEVQLEFPQITEHGRWNGCGNWTRHIAQAVATDSKSGHEASESEHQ